MIRLRQSCCVEIPQVRELVDEVVWEEHCIGHAADADLDIKVSLEEGLCCGGGVVHVRWQC